MTLPKSFYVRRLGKALLAEEWNLAGLLRRSRAVVAQDCEWFRPLATQILARWPRRPPRLRDLTATILCELEAIFATEDGLDSCGEWSQLWDESTAALLAVPGMRPCEPAVGWQLPAITTPAALAEWLQISLGELDWLSDVQGRNRHVHLGRLQHFRYAWIRKRHGSARLIESPKSRLKTVQRQLLRQILDRIPIHSAAHGFCVGRSVKSFVSAHVAQAVLLRLDLRDFFPTIAAAQINALFMSLGYPETVAQLLTGLCTNRVPTPVLDELHDKLPRSEARRLVDLYGRRHLPQGAPTSPALANLCAFSLDLRLSGLAQAAGGQYSRYADDLLFSGDADFARATRRFQVMAAAIAIDEGFAVQFRKTRVMRPGVRQHAAGLTLNVRVNVKRDGYDRLKATLHRCLKNGPAGENRHAVPDFRAHLAGKVGYVESINPARGAKLRAMFSRIVWPSTVE